MSLSIKIIAMASILTISFGSIVQAQEPREVPEGVVEIFDGQPSDEWYTLQQGETLVVQTEDLGHYFFEAGGYTKAILAVGSLGNESIVVTSDEFIPVEFGQALRIADSNGESIFFVNETGDVEYYLYHGTESEPIRVS